MMVRLPVWPGTVCQSDLAPSASLTSWWFVCQSDLARTGLKTRVTVWEHDSSSASLTWHLKDVFGCDSVTCSDDSYREATSTSTTSCTTWRHWVATRRRHVSRQEQTFDQRQSASIKSLTSSHPSHWMKYVSMTALLHSTAAAVVRLLTTPRRVL